MCKYKYLRLKWVVFECGFEEQVEEMITLVKMMEAGKILLKTNKHTL